ncbi:MAG: hypothetical protein KatS3mg095_0806 [Candidatus Parcubacteria bacterium]|nr:MAG: hypothetical protein KatS3mg095_0806 [Candidatus Parcubacteria bacterium]
MVYSILLGLIPISIILFYFSTQPGLKMLEEITKGTYFFNSWQITLSLFVFLISIIGLLVYTLNNNLIFKSEAVAIGFLVVLSCIIVLLPKQTLFLQQEYYYKTFLSFSGILWAVLFNTLIFLELIGIIFLGYLKRDNWLINSGVFFIFILIFVKYFDWFFSFLDKSVFFIGAGILLFAVGWFMEKGRRHLLSTIKKEDIRQNQ